MDVSDLVVKAVESAPFAQNAYIVWRRGERGRW